MTDPGDILLLWLIFPVGFVLIWAFWNIIDLLFGSIMRTIARWGRHDSYRDD
jgi:hypothetical protein